jgi:hypothetical protein
MQIAIVASSCFASLTAVDAPSRDSAEPSIGIRIRRIISCFLLTEVVCSVGRNAETWSLPQLRCSRVFASLAKLLSGYLGECLILCSKRL